MRLKQNKNESFFHQFEVAFCGFSNSGKTTLISKLITKLADDFDIGFLKHDAHKFTMDHTGKDTHVMREAGAKSVLINDEKHFANIQDNELEQFDVQMNMIDMDLLFIEGHKFSKLPKFVLIAKDDNYDAIIDHIDKNEITDIVAVISEETLDPFNGKYPFFNREEINQIASFILELFHKKIPKTIKGLILTGGKSERMKEDKGALSYHGELSQIDYSKSLLSGVCDEVFVSCRESQKDLDFLKKQNLLFDSFPSVGPATGILSAQFLDPNCAWIVLACDLPYLDKLTIVDLVNNRNPFKNATCFLNPKRKWPEPLCTIYEPKSYQKLMQYFSINKPCPRKVLFNSNINALNLINETALDNVNTPSEKEQAFRLIKTYGKNHAN
jgi:molybdopterin-guanine dinucleotide biosynthesis protein MobB